MTICKKELLNRAVYGLQEAVKAQPPFYTIPTQEKGLLDKAIKQAITTYLELVKVQMELDEAEEQELRRKFWG